MTRWLVLLLWLAAGVAHADERILAYDSRIQVAADGSLEVTEKITVRAEGANIRRGIYRDFPTRYSDRFKNRVVVGFKVLDVQRDGREEPWFTQNKRNGIRINTGNDDLLPVPAQFTYTLRYRTTRQLGFFAGNDELYFNAIGTGWDFPIDAGSVEVRLPQPVPVDQMHVEGYTGPQGSRDQDYVAITPQPGVARWRLTRPLQAREGLAVVLTFPKGVVTPPTRAQGWVWFFRDNGGVLVALLGLVVLLVFCVRRWHRVGRDPRAGVVIAQYEPPEGHTPAGLRYMWKMHQDTRCFSSDLLALAVAGQVRIHREEGFFKDTWSLERIQGVKMDGLGASERALLSTLFSSGPRLVLKDSNATTMAAATTAQGKALGAQFQPAMFNRNGASILAAAGIALASVVLAAIVGGQAGMPATVLVAVVMLLTIIAFAVLVNAPTPEGRKLLDAIEGLRLYLGVAERDDLARLGGPGGPPALDAKRFEQLLPYAVALEVEDAWTRKFTAAVGAAAAAAATSAIGWYHGGHSGDLGSFTKSLGSTLSSQIASSSSPPGSSSGSGGGGFSGGGGGGGGGGGR